MRLKNGTHVMIVSEPRYSLGRLEPGTLATVMQQVGTEAVRIRTAFPDQRTLVIHKVHLKPLVPIIQEHLYRKALELIATAEEGSHLRYATRGWDIKLDLRNNTLQLEILSAWLTPQENKETLWAIKQAMFYKHGQILTIRNDLVLSITL